MLLLLLRLSVFSLFIGAVVHVVRNSQPGNSRRMGIAVGWAVATTAVAGFGMVLAKAPARGLIFWVPGLTLMIGVLGYAIYCGQMLGDQQGGYWFKKNPRVGPAVAWGAGVVTGLLAYDWVLLRSKFLLMDPGWGLPKESVPTFFNLLAWSVSEEFFFRGCVQAMLVVWMARLPRAEWWAIAFTAIVFTLQHVTTTPLVIFPAAIAFGILFARFGLWTAAGVHFAANLVSAFILPRLA